MAARGRFEVRFSDGRAVLNLDEIWRAIYDQQRIALYGAGAQLQKVDTGWTGPSLETLEIDFAAAATEGAKQADTIFAGLLRKIDDKAFTIESLRAQLKAYLGSAEGSRVFLNRMIADNAAKNAKAVSDNVKYLGWAIGGLEFLRDASVTLLGVGAGMMSGGTAIVFLGVGSGIGATAKIQDSKASMTWQDAVGKGYAVAMTDFTFGLVTMGMGSALKTAGKVTKAAVTITIDTMSNALTGLVISEPDENGKAAPPSQIVGDAFANAVVSQGLSSLLDARKGTAINQKIRRVLLPATSAMAKASDAKLVGVAMNTAKNVVQEVGKKGLSAVLAKGGDKTTVTGKMVSAPFFGGAEVLEARLKQMITQLPGG